MARQVSRSYLTQSGRDSGGFVVEWDGVDYVQRQMAKIADGLTWNADGTDLVPRRTAANRELRQAAKEIANDLLIPQMKRTARSAPVPIARAMAETARAKSDRLIAVQVGGVNPPLSGFRRGVGVKRARGRSGGKMRDATSRTFRTTLAWGSEFGPLGGRRRPSRGDNVPAREVNHYKVARRYPRGYWVLPAVDDVRVKAQARFKRAVDEIVDYHTQGRG
jgi:hypothetical protein